MDPLARRLRAVVQLLDEIKARYALVGGMAIGIWCEPRFTRDVDLALAVDSDVQAQAIVRHLLTSGYKLVQELDQTAMDRIATIRLAPPDVIFVADEEDKPEVIDLLFATCGIEQEIVQGAVTIEVAAGMSVKVAQLEHLIAMKVLSGDDKRRIQDKADLQALFRVATPEQIAAARDLLKLITDRGFHRGRDLDALLDTALHG